MQGTRARRIAPAIVLVAALFNPCGTLSYAQTTAPAFVGVRTFLGAPYVPRLETIEADFAVLGVPFDEGTWGQPGARYGPRDVRENSQEYHFYLTEGFYYIDQDRTVLKGKRWVDVGDVEVFPTVPAQTGEKVTSAVKTILGRKALPIVIGGDHSITFPVLRAYRSPLTLIHFDAHLDTWNAAPGNLDHSSWVNRTAALPHVKKVVQVGMRGLANDQEAMGNARKIGSTIITSEQIHRKGAAWALSQIPASERIYVTLDVDVLDPSVAPGTGTIEPDGLSFAELDDLLKGLPAKGRLVGLDVVEITPYRDPSGRTAQTAVRLIIDLLGAAFP